MEISYQLLKCLSLGVKFGRRDRVFPEALQVVLWLKTHQPTVCSMLEAELRITQPQLTFIGWLAHSQ